MYFSFESFLEFKKEKTGINIVKVPVTDLELPTITVCPKESFKNLDAQTSKFDILGNLSNYSYAWKDFFHSDFLKKLHEWNHRKIFNIRLGVCFSLKYTKNVTGSIHVTFLKNNNYQVILFAMIESEHFIQRVFF